MFDDDDVPAEIDLSKLSDVELKELLSRLSNGEFEKLYWRYQAKRCREAQEIVLMRRECLDKFGVPPTDLDDQILKSADQDLAELERLARVGGRIPRD
jgi:hypothetical protein